MTHDSHAPPVERSRIPVPTPPCPMCGYDLRATVAAGHRSCPECNWKFTDQDLVLLGPSNSDGAPISLKPADSRIKGPWLLAILALVSAAFVIATIILTRQ